MKSTEFERKDLEEAARNYATEGDEISGEFIFEQEYEAFKKGAQYERRYILSEIEKAIEDIDYYTVDGLYNTIIEKINELKT